LELSAPSIIALHCSFEFRGLAGIAMHKPFSYTFALLPLIHIGVVIAAGYF
jgi:hypothetical protein